MSDSAALLFKGRDEVLLSAAVGEAVAELVDDGDRELMLTDLGAKQYEHDGDIDIGAVVDAARTPPFLTDRRIVVARNLAVFKIAQLSSLLEYLAAPIDTTVLVLVWERGPSQRDKLSAVPKRLSDAVAKAGGRIIDTAAGRGKQRAAWLDEQLSASGLTLDAPARRLLVDHLGEDAGRLPGVLTTLVGAYGHGASISVNDLEPYLIGSGDVAPWDLTDAIDAGDPTAALAVLARMLGSGRHPLQMMASLHNHYAKMLALDGAGVSDPKAAAELLGMRGSTFPAKKALDQSRKLGSDRLCSFVELLAEADLDLRGARHLPEEAVIEVLVARLASRSRR